MIKISKKLILEEKDIIFIDHYDRKTYLHMINNEIISTYKSTKYIMDLLPNNFIKINKALIVNKDHIIQIDGCMYEMDNHEILWGAIRIAGYHRRINKEMKGIRFIKK